MTDRMNFSNRQNFLAIYERLIQYSTYRHDIFRPPDRGVVRSAKTVISDITKITAVSNHIRLVNVDIHTS